MSLSTASERSESLQASEPNEEVVHSGRLGAREAKPKGYMGASIDSNRIAYGLDAVRSTKYTTGLEGFHDVAAAEAFVSRSSADMSAATMPIRDQLRQGR